MKFKAKIMEITVILMCMKNHINIESSTRVFLLHTFNLRFLRKYIKITVTN